MKKILALLILTIFSCTSQAQQVLACQFSESTGFKSNPGRWSSANFLIGKPFFLRINNDELIDKKSLENLLFYPDDTVCKKYNSRNAGLRTACVEIDSGNGIVLSLETLTGAVSALSGAASSNVTKRDDVSVSLFNCQKM